MEAGSPPPQHPKTPRNWMEKYLASFRSEIHRVRLLATPFQVLTAFFYGSDHTSADSRRFLIDCHLPMPDSTQPECESLEVFRRIPAGRLKACISISTLLPTVAISAHLWSGYQFGTEDSRRLMEMLELQHYLLCASLGEDKVRRCSLHVCGMSDNLTSPDATVRPIATPLAVLPSWVCSVQPSVPPKLHRYLALLAKLAVELSSMLPSSQHIDRSSAHTRQLTSFVFRLPSIEQVVTTAEAVSVRRQMTTFVFRVPSMEQFVTTAEAVSVRPVISGSDSHLRLLSTDQRCPAYKPSTDNHVHQIELYR